ncbi:MAG: hypothetical protein A2255_03230 [Candidatus Melainabacteria bacterium RIFOXYA2_FULL_32_9]|nr:MAG: hypothetical protein A2255_03230 [Candidatus Melainabacteria bacterium RIFOXYA2_FULL_32_9]
MIKKLFNLEENTREKFKKHFIKSVVVNIAFSNLSKQCILKNEEYLKTEFKKLGFDQSGQIKQVEFTMSIEDEKPKKLTNEENVTGLLFNNQRLMKNLEIIENSVICVDNQYEGFEFFAENIENIISVINKISLANNSIEKLGFRKVNSFVSTETQNFETITELVNDSVFAPLRTNLIDISNFKEHIETIIVENEHCKSRLIFACTKTNPNEFRVNIDLDLIDNKLCNRYDIVKRIETLNNVAYNLFIWSTTSKFRNIMNDTGE